MGNRTILVIDYDPESIRSTMQSLVRAGYRVEVAQDGVEGLKAFDRLKPDLVLIEPMVPKKHGFQVCQEIKQKPGGDGTPVLITTAFYKSRRHRSEAKEHYGCDDYLLKPIAEDLLLSTCSKYLVDTPARPRSEGVGEPPADPAKPSAAHATDREAEQLPALENMSEEELMARLDAMIVEPAPEATDRPAAAASSSSPPAQPRAEPEVAPSPAARVAPATAPAPPSAPPPAARVPTAPASASPSPAPAKRPPPAPRGATPSARPVADKAQARRMAAPAGTAKARTEPAAAPARRSPSPSRPSPPAAHVPSARPAAPAPRAAAPAVPTATVRRRGATPTPARPGLAPPRRRSPRLLLWVGGVGLSLIAAGIAVLWLVGSGPVELPPSPRDVGALGPTTRLPATQPEPPTEPFDVPTTPIRENDAAPIRLPSAIEGPKEGASGDASPAPIAGGTAADRTTQPLASASEAARRETEVAGPPPKPQPAPPSAARQPVLEPARPPEPTVASAATDPEPSTTRARPVPENRERPVEEAADTGDPRAADRGVPTDGSTTAEATTTTDGATTTDAGSAPPARPAWTPPPKPRARRGDLMRLVDVDQPPVPLRRPLPTYPPIARRLRLEGTVVLRLLVNERGAVAEVELVSGVDNRALDGAALDAARDWKYEPAVADDVPVKVWITERLVFQL